MSSRSYSSGNWRDGAGERPAQAFYVVGERGGPAQLIDVERPEQRIIAEATAFVHTLADRVDAVRRGLERCVGL